MVISLAAFLSEIGMIPALCATGDKSGSFENAIKSQIQQVDEDITILEDTDFIDIEEAARKVNPDIIIGNSNGYKLKRALDIPLVRVGLPDS